MKQLWVVLMLILAVSCIRTIEARIIRVPMEFNTIQTAINNTNNGDTVLVSRNRYQERVNFNGRSISVMSEYVFTNDEQDITQTIIDGGGNDGSVVVIRQAQEAVLSGFTITGGLTDFGGAIYCRESNATFSHLIVERNTVDRNGAGIYCTRQGNVLIHDVIIRNNSAGYVGGGFSCFGGANVTMRNVLMYENQCEHVGGALHCYNAELTLENVTIINNDALHSGGALYVTQAGRVRISSSILRDNIPHEIYLVPVNDSTHVDILFSNIDGGFEQVVDDVESRVEWLVGNIDADPNFVDAERNDYRLENDSPCIDAGHLEHDPDPDGTRRDMGMYYSHQEDGGSFVLHVPDDYDTIQQAIDEANDGDVVLVQPGEYFENIELTSDITVGSKVLSTGNISYIDSTIIDGDGEGSVIRIFGDIPDALINGFTIQNGVTVNNGGGIVCSRTNVTLSNLLVRENTASEGDGGGIYIRNDDGEEELNNGPILQHVSVMNNEAYGRGGGIYISHANGYESLFEDVQIIGNEASSGGGMYISSSNLVLRDVIISDNSAVNTGGLVIKFSEPEFFRVQISGNSAEGTGSAIYLWAANPRMNNVTIASNTDEQGSSVIVFGIESHLELINSIIWGNEPENILIAGDDNMITVQYSDIENGEEAVVVREGLEIEMEWGEGNIDVDPQFNNADEGNYSLMDNSPCIDAGDEESPRDPDGTVADMGAFYKEQEFDYRRLFMVPDDFETIQAAIDVSQRGDSILVRPGRYEENINMRGRSIFLGSLFAITHDPAYIDSTIIDGGGNDVTVKFALGESGTLSGFRIVNGRGREGGGIFIYNSFPEIEYCTITGNSSESGGGGVFCYGGSPDFTNCTISGNQVDEGAGGFHLESLSWVHLSNCIFWGNEPEEIVFGSDGDVSTIFVENSVIEGGEDGIITNFNGDVNWDGGNIDQNPQFVDSDNGDYYLQENSPCIDAGARGLVVDPDGSPADIGAYYFDHGGEVVDFSINLSAGWNVISSPVQPPILSMEAVFSESIADENLLIVKNQEGRFFRPDQEFNNINGWDVRFGYWVKVSEAEVLVISNRFVQEDHPIPLDDGWSIVSYFPQQRTEVGIATAGIVEELIIVKDDRGRFYLPEFEFSNMAPLRQGLGYQLKVDDDIELVWRTDGEELGPLYADNGVGSDSEHSQFIHRQDSRYNMSVLIAELASFEGIAELGAFGSDGVCVGSVILNHDGKTGLAVWGDDPTTKLVDGLRDGDNISFKVWTNGNEQQAEIEWILGNGDYHTDSYAVGKLSFDNAVPHEFAFNAPYPNPFNSTVRLSFTLPEANLITLSVYDISGRLVSSEEQFYPEAGNYQISLNAGKWSSGIYFAELNAGVNFKMKKMVLVK